MPATPITASDRYWPVGTEKWYWVAAIADYTSPTRSELNAGTDLTPEIFEYSGFQVTGDEIDVPDRDSDFTGKIPGRTSADDSSIKFYADSTSDDVRTLLPRGTVGHIVRLPEGDVAGHLMDVFPVRVKAASMPQ